MFSADIFSRQVWAACSSKLQFHMRMPNMNFNESRPSIDRGSDYACAHSVNHLSSASTQRNGGDLSLSYIKVHGTAISFTALTAEAESDRPTC